MIDEGIAYKIREHEGLADSILNYFSLREVWDWGDLELYDLWEDVKPKLERINQILIDSINQEN